LRSVTFNRLPGQDDIARAVLQLCRCPQITRLSFYRPRIPQKSVFGLPAPTARDFPAVVSDVHSLAINFCHGVSLGFVKFLGCITLRRARVLLLKTEHTYHPVCWSQTAFLAFSTRSSLHDRDIQSGDLRRPTSGVPATRGDLVGLRPQPLGRRPGQLATPH
jgi:hypothetical protein